MRIVFVERIENDLVFLDPQEQHHLTKVLRKQPGYEFVGFDGKGSRYRCLLARDGKSWLGKIIESLDPDTESYLNLRLAQALIKKDKFEWVLQKTAELGVSRVTPIIRWRTEVDLNDSRAKKRFYRWERIILEAVKQCGRNRVPTLDYPVKLEELLRDQHNGGVG